MTESGCAAASRCFCVTAWQGRSKTQDVFWAASRRVSQRDRVAGPGDPSRLCLSRSASVAAVCEAPQRRGQPHGKSLASRLSIQVPMGPAPPLL
jgi:hypothetical protein